MLKCNYNKKEVRETMARKKKNLTIDEQIAQLEEQIKAAESNLKEQKNQLKGLREEKRQMEMDSLYQLISESGKTIDEVKHLIMGGKES